MYDTRYTSTQQSIRSISTSQQRDRDRNNKMPRLDEWKVEKQQIELKQDLRKWIKLADNPEPPNSFTFKLICYNVLSQTILDNHKYLYPKNTHKERYLKWGYRWEALQHEFREHNADIICLQEVQESHYVDYYQFFHDSGYEGIFKQRTNSIYPDGCAIFYKTKALNMIEFYGVEYFQPKTNLLDRHNVGLIAKFSPKNSNRSFVVATTHLLFNPKREDVRLAQTQVLLTEINRISYDYKEQRNVPVILCGDFNSSPTVTNGVYQFITKQLINYQNVYHLRQGKSWLPPELGVTNDCRHLNLAKSNPNVPLSRSEEEELIQLHHSSRRHNINTAIKSADLRLFESGELVHRFNFTSVYPTVEGVSTNQDNWVLVDYLFHTVTKDKLMGEMKCLGRYELPTVAGLNSKHIKGIPNIKVGSDHFPLVAQFRFDF